MHLHSILFFLGIIYPISGSRNIERNTRFQPEEPTFIQTECILIDSVAKERCFTRTSIDNDGHETQTQSCVTDERFRVKYQIRNGQSITSSIETFGRNFPSLMQIGERYTCYYNPQNVQIIRWTVTNENNNRAQAIVTYVLEICIGLVVISFFIYIWMQK